MTEYLDIVNPYLYTSALFFFNLTCILVTILAIMLTISAGKILGRIKALQEQIQDLTNTLEDTAMKAQNSLSDSSWITSAIGGAFELIKSGISSRRNRNKFWF